MNCCLERQKELPIWQLLLMWRVITVYGIYIELLAGMPSHVRELWLTANTVEMNSPVSFDFKLKVTEPSLPVVAEPEAVPPSGNSIAMDTVAPVTG